MSIPLPLTELIAKLPADMTRFSITDVENYTAYQRRLSPATMAAVMEVINALAEHVATERDGITGNTVLRVTDCPVPLELAQRLFDVRTLLNGQETT